MVAKNSRVVINKKDLCLLTILNNLYKKIQLTVNSEYMDNCVQEELPVELVELVQSKVNESNLPEKESHVLFTLLYDHPEVCTPSLGRTHLVQHKITVRSDVVVAQKPYRLPVHKKEIVKEQIDDMLARDIIQPSHSSWASPIVLVPKKDGGQRFCVDYRRLNAVSESDAFPLPTVGEIWSLLLEPMSLVPLI